MISHQCKPSTTLYRVVRSFEIRFFSSPPNLKSLTPKPSTAFTKTGNLFTPPTVLREKASEIISHRVKVYADEPPPEPFLHAFYRWCDISGVFSRWNNRKYWCLTSPPLLRMDAVMMTEYERKVHLFRETNIQIFVAVTLAVALVFYYYRSARQPLPQIVGLEGPFRSIMGYMSTLPLMYPKKRCPHCRLYDPECKKACFEKLRAAGHKMFLDETRLRAWSTPRIHLKSSPYVKSAPEV